MDQDRLVETEDGVEEGIMRIPYHPCTCACAFLVKRAKTTGARHPKDTTSLVEEDVVVKDFDMPSRCESAMLTCCQQD